VVGVTWVAITLLIVAMVAVTARRLSAPDEHEPTDAERERAFEVDVELHRIRRRFDVALTKTELRRDAAELRRDLDEQLRATERPDDGRRP